jgi:hypothetical protein
MNTVESQAVDATPSIAEQLAALETRVAELERCKHEDHTIGGEAVTKIASIVKADIAGLLHPQRRAEAEG